MTAARHAPDVAFRTYAGPADVPVIGAMVRQASLHDHAEFLPADVQIAHDFAHAEGFDPALDTFLAEIGGRVVAVGQIQYVRRDGAHTFQLTGAVDPGMRHQGIGRAVLDRLEARATERLVEFADDGPVSLTAWMPDRNTAFAALARSAGYDPVHSFFEMVKADLASDVEPTLPDGLELRPAVKADLRRIFDAEAEAFQDHWGRRDWSDAIFTSLLEDPLLDLDLWRVAWDGSEVAGVVATWIVPEENAQLGIRRGWLGQVSVRRPWRRRGLAAALILSACIGLRERGMDDAALGVDAASLTGAVGLYERLGFAVHQRETYWSKFLRPGPAAG